MKYLHTYIELTLRKLKDLKGKSDWEIKMISRNRKNISSMYSMSSENTFRES